MQNEARPVLLRLRPGLKARPFSTEKGFYQNKTGFRQQTKPSFMLRYSGCQKNVPLFECLFLQPLIPPFRISEFVFEKRYKYAARLSEVHPKSYVRSTCKSHKSPIWRTVHMIPFTNQSRPCTNTLSPGNLRCRIFLLPARYPTVSYHRTVPLRWR